jgi:hypothetical protein
MVAARRSARVEQLLVEAAELDADERAALVEGLTSEVEARNAEIVRRARSVREGEAQPLSLAEVEASLRSELDL